MVLHVAAVVFSEVVVDAGWVVANGGAAGADSAVNIKRCVFKRITFSHNIKYILFGKNYISINFPQSRG